MFRDWPAAPASHARNGPPTSWAGWEVVSQTGREAQPKAFPSGGRCPSAHTGADEGRSCTQPFLVEKGGYRLSPQRNFSFAPLGKSVAPSSVTFGDSFPKGSLWVVDPTRKSVPNQGTYMGTETATLPKQCATSPKTSERAQAGHKKGGATPASLRPGFL